MLAKFDEYHSEILGGFLDTLVEAIKLYPSVQPKELFRMADFTRWGCAIAKALGYSEKDFVNAYARKVRAQIEEAALSSPLATVLMDFMDSEKKWQGTPSALYKILVEHAKKIGISKQQKAWPRAPNALVRQLNELVPSLKALGLEVITGVRSGSEGTRRILINTVRTVSEYRNQHQAADDTDDISSTSFRGTVDSYFLTCFLCRQPIHTKKESYTYEEGKPCHTACLQSHKQAMGDG